MNLLVSKNVCCQKSEQTLEQKKLLSRGVLQNSCSETVLKPL